MKLMTFSFLLLTGAVLSNGVQAVDNNVHFSGALVAEPCRIPDGDSNIKLSFGSVIVKGLYQYQRTKSQPFIIYLENCDPALMKTVSVTFEGTPDDELTTMLALEPSSVAKGVAVGLELVDGTPLAINKASPYQPLSQGNNALTFNAYVQGKPSAITNEQIIPGDFNAIATFVLVYQ
ncbi:fimbrial protein [Citrobacter farmeri]|uniref:Fimbrial protein n=1 Tax=Citrobacter amalonaticus Y19 TaxID=1261127 RepID=M1K195_CITAM|nr:fimbrial protein [Citrobacter amalonaticus]AGE94451.1 fimbrial protein [Citrobacter amalonaticus Y19]EKV5654376.1 type 1 fimbrial protein [Citrobacter farmeri]